MTPKESSALAAQIPIMDKVAHDAMHALARGGWELDVKAEGDDEKIDLIVWRARRAGECYVVAAKRNRDAPLELQRQTGA